MDSNLESEEVQAISDEESLAPGDPSEPESETEQWLSISPKENKPSPKAYSPHKYYRDVTSGTFCHNCRNHHPTGETIEQVVVGSEVTSTFPIKIQGTPCTALIDTGATKSCMSETFFNSLPKQNIKNLHRIIVWSATGSNLCLVGFTTC